MYRTTTLDPLQRRIIAALQVDGRAPWRKIARVLGEPERTVARHGIELLAQGHVTVAGIENRRGAVVTAFSCTPGASRMACEALAQRIDTSYSYLTTGPNDVVTELHYSGDPTDILTTQLPATPGVARYSTYPVLKYFKTIRGWRVGLLNSAEEQALASPYGADQAQWDYADDLDDTDHAIIQALREDGRASLESMARRVGLSESSVSRRMDWMLRNTRATIRTLVEPGLLGLPVEAQLWIQAAPDQIDSLGRRLADLVEVRYCAAIAGEYQLLVDVTLPNQTALYEFLSDPDRNAGASRVNSSLVVRARKRGGRLFEIPT
ncbi:Lrp/AsnC family transcriptional regulator [Corynebacterium sp. A21]|uniref:Lrp/AsnC family transcriptional regulator n=1 Tax=Corynebacterium sp. A21 TaxID=3457318 RepID=UPI003FD47AF8